MKIFLSWSGAKSRQVAEVLRAWLPGMLQAVRPYFSPEDIGKGARWSAEIAKELDVSSVGIICLTRDNLSAPWLMFEAGALAKNLDRSRIIPLLVGVEQSDVSGPLAQFQLTRFDKVEVKRAIKVINEALPDSLAPDVLDAAYETWWPQLESKLNAVASPQRQGNKAKRIRTDREVLDEILYLLRTEVFRAQSETEEQPKRVVIQDGLTEEDLELPLGDLELPDQIKALLAQLGVRNISELFSRSDVRDRLGEHFVRGIAQMVVHRRSLNSGFAHTNMSNMDAS